MRKFLFSRHLLFMYLSVIFSTILFAKQATTWEKTNTVVVGSSIISDDFINPLWLGINQAEGILDTGCLNAMYGQYPDENFTPECVGQLVEIVWDAYGGEYSKVNLTAGITYTFASERATDYITISNEAGTTVFTAGIASLTYTPTTNQVVRFYLHNNISCQSSSIQRSKYVGCGELVEITPPDFECLKGDGLIGSVDEGFGADTGDVYRAADDFTVDAGTVFTIHEITTDILTPTVVTNATLNIRSNVDNLPGGIIRTVTMAPTTSTLHNGGFGLDGYHLTFSLTTPIILEEGSYWLEPVFTATDNEYVFWQAFDPGTTSEFVVFSDDAGNSWFSEPDLEFQAVFFVAGICEEAEEPEEGCLEAPYGQYPEEDYTPLCNGTAESITEGDYGYFGEFSRVNVTEGTEYIFSTDVATAYITISDAAGTTVITTGTGSVTWTSTLTGVIRYYTHENEECLASDEWVDRMIQCGEIVPPPSNDDCANAIAVSCGETMTGSTVSATNSGGNTSADVFYTFTGNGIAQNVTLSLCDSDFDTYLRVYTDCSLSTQIAFNDDACGNRSELTFESDGTSTYYIMVEGYGSNTGNYVLDVTCEDIETEEPQEGCLEAPYGQYPEEDYTPLCNGTAESITEGDYGYFGEYSSVNVTEGTQYIFSTDVATAYITISDAAGTTVITTGTGSVTWTSTLTGVIRYYTHENEECLASDEWVDRMIQCGEIVPPPANDDCANAIAVSCGETMTGSTVNATNSGGNTAADVFYTFTGNGIAQNVTLSLCDSDFDTYLRVYTDCSLSTQIAFNDDACGNRSELTFESDGTSTYYIMVEGYSSNTGNYVLNVTCEDIDTEEPEEGCLDTPNGQWASITPACSGAPELVTSAAWTGEYSNVTVTAGTEYTFSSSVTTDFITIANTGGTVVYAAGVSPLTWTATTSETVRFIMHNNSDCDYEDVSRSKFVQCGEVLPPPSNDDCDNAIAVSCGDSVNGATTFATNSGGNAAGDVFYKFTGTGDAQMVTLSLCESSYDTYLRVFTDCSLTTEVAFNDDACGVQSELTFMSDGTSTYYIMVEGYSSNTGNYVLNVSCEEPIAYDPCAPIHGGTPTNGVGFVNNGAEHYVAANDFNVLADTQFAVEKITIDVVTLGGEPTTFDLSFHEGAAAVGAQFGDMMEGITPTSITENGVFGTTGYLMYSVEFTLDTPIVFPATATADKKYWVALTGYPTANNNPVFWVSSAYLNTDTLPTWQSADGGTTWAIFAPSVEGNMMIEGECATLGLTDLSGTAFSYYPNPVKDVLHINAAKGIEKVEVFNLAGQKLMNETKVSNGEVDVKTLTPGTYVFRVSLEDGQIETFKIIKK